MITAADIQGGKILIVDDMRANVLLLERMLRDAGYTSVGFTMNPTEVFELHSKNRYDLILLDVQMPGMDGFQVMDSLREIEHDGYLPVLAVTAEPTHKLRALHGGAKDFISKPFDLPEVLMRVRNMLEVRLLHNAAKNHAKILESLALYDPLTGLANRRLLNERMAMGLVHARRDKSLMAVVYLDLDGFKKINDTLGHAAGDDLLKMVARRLEETVREEDTVARLGGDEFSLALWTVSDEAVATAVATKVIEALGRPYTLAGQEVTVTASAGIALYPLHGADAEALMKGADKALYEAKHSGKNACRVAAVV